MVCLFNLLTRVQSVLRVTMVCVSSQRFFLWVTMAVFLHSGFLGDYGCVSSQRFLGVTIICVSSQRFLGVTVICVSSQRFLGVTIICVSSQRFLGVTMAVILHP